MTLTCGDRAGNGTGSPEYQFPVEGTPMEPVGNAAPLPAGASPSPGESASVVPSYYGKGTIVLANLDQNANGAQFLIVYGDGSNLPNQFTPVGTITKGLEIVEAIAAGGAVDANNVPAPAGKPTTELKIDKLLVQDEVSMIPTGAASTEATPSASASS
jgi:peptidyl-prolyl cis-trans isomerase B (cyclophilin B)